jgi:dihydroorotase
VTSLILAKAAAASSRAVYPIGACRRASKGELLADIAELKRPGASRSPTTAPAATALLLRRALEYAGMFGMPVIEHCEDPTLKGDGVAHEGFHASRLGLRGIPGACESLGVERGVLLAELTGSAFHVAHMSARASMRAVRKAKERRARHLRGGAASLHAHRRGARHAVALRHQHEDEPAAARGADRDAMLAGIADGTWT